MKNEFAAQIPGSRSKDAQRTQLQRRSPVNRSSYEDEEIRWLTVIRTQVAEAGALPTEKLLWVGFLD
jgi:hypothetical protein